MAQSKKIPTSFAEKAKKIFKCYPTVSELYFASNGMPFFLATDAKIYANALRNSEVKIIKRKYDVTTRKN